MRIAGGLAPDRVQGAGTEAGFTIGELTLEGTIELVIFIGIFSGMAGAVVDVVFRPWLAWAGRWRGPAFGLLLFAISSATSDLLNPDNFDFIILGNEALLVALIVALFVAYGVMIEWVFGVLNRRLPAATDRKRVRNGYFAITGVGLGLALPLVLSSLFTSQTCDCDPPLIASVFVAVAAVATLLWWSGGLRETQSRTATWAPLLGFVGLAGALVFGLLRAVSDALDVIT